MAGQSVPRAHHPPFRFVFDAERLTEDLLSADVHVHIIPRRAKDFEPLDESEWLNSDTAISAVGFVGQTRPSHS